MAKDLTGIRTARSTMHISGTTQENQLLDFRFAISEGLRLHGIMPMVLDIDRTGAAAAHLETAVVQYLHLEEDVPEILPIGGTVPSAQVVDIDTEILGGQATMAHFLEDGVNGEGGVALSSTPNGLIVFPEPILIASNLTHTARCDDANIDASLLMIIFYQRVRLSSNEFMLALARER